MTKLKLLGTYALLLMAVSTGVMGNNVIDAQAHVTQTSDRNAGDVDKADNTKNAKATKSGRNKSNVKNANATKNKKDRTNKKDKDCSNSKNTNPKKDKKNTNVKKDTDNPVIATPKLNLTKRTDNAATFKVGKNKDTNTYEIYRSTSSNGEYTLIGTTKNGEFVDTDLKANCSYYYKAKSLKSDFSDIIFVGENLESPKNLQGVRSDDSITLNWTKVSQASKYKIYRSTSQDGDYAKVGTSKNNNFVDKSIEDNSTYYYKVIAIRTIKKATYTSPFSDVIKVSTPATTDNSNSDANSQLTEKYATEVLQLINAERAKIGLSALTTTNSLSDAANLRAAEIKGLFSHTRPDGSNSFTVLDKYNINYQAAGENIAYGQKTPEAVVEAWMNSAGHRANILNSSFGKVGIGCYVASDGTLYWTQLFTD